MEHDEKRKSHEGESLTAQGNERANNPQDGSAANGSQSSSSVSDTSSPLSADFGMPKLNFSHAARGRMAAKNTPTEPAQKTPATSANSGLPLGEDTGWESGASIARIGSLNARLNAQENPYMFAPDYLDEPSDLPQPPRQQATVMPFPGSSMARSADTNAMLRDVKSETGFTPDFDEYDDNLPSDTAADQDDGDTLADAVQLALRSVYGSQNADQGDDDEQDGYMVAGTLMGGNSRGQEFAWPQAAAYPDEEEEDRYQAKEQESASAEANTEAVLEYLYGRRRPEHEGIELTLDTALRDYDPAPDQGGTWNSRNDDDDTYGTPFPGVRDYTPPQRGGRATPEAPRYRPEPRQPAETLDWEQAAYMPNLPMRADTPVYANQPEQLSGGSDSGHLLGAAGLGLIGGIALAGVLAVFVFNSFIDVNDSSVKTGERLEAQASAQAVTPGFAKPSRGVEEARPSLSTGDGQPRLIAQSVTGGAGEPIKLDIGLANPAAAEEALVSIKGLPKEAKLSTGIDVGGGQWLLPPARLKSLNITVPPGTSGVHNLAVQLLKDDAQTSLTEPAQFTLNVNSKTANAGSAAAPVALPDENAQAETDFVTQMLIRDGNKAMREGDIVAARRLYEQAATSGNPEAALAMGRSFDPTYFERLNVKTGKPDPATAFEWYKKALDGGLITARVKIDALKQWLQR